MAKRYFLQLSYPLNYDKDVIGGGYLSEKFDGMRAFWDGGISRGLMASHVPWANTAKDFRMVNAPVATGLWSRYGNVINAPDFFLDSLPSVMLDGELWMGRQRFQDTMSVCRSLNAGDRWNEVKFLVLDVPNYNVIFADGTIEETNFKKRFIQIPKWVTEKGYVDPISPGTHQAFHTRLSWLSKHLEGNQYVELVHQERLPAGTPQARERIEEKLTEVLATGGEGVVIKRPSLAWMPFRSHDIMKYKPENDAEGIVTGYIWGRETDKGSKLLGLMGALVLDFNGKRLELSGFTDEERAMTLIGSSPDNPCATEEGKLFPGSVISENWTNPTFPIGSKVTFKFREYTRDGLPKEARYFRKRTDI